MNVPELSVIIPALNEAASLPRLLAQLRAQAGVQLEIVVADGGSTDDTPQLAATADVLVRAPRGRGAQMNAGARAARAEALLFLHADSELGHSRVLQQALAFWRPQAAKRSAGHFALRFTQAQPGHENFFRYLEAKTRLNRPGTINGDQGLLIRREYLDELGGFDESLPFLEDARIGAKISAGGHWLLLPGELGTSARRFESEGHAARYTLMALMMGLHAAGAEEFFTQAPQVYRAQPQAGPLALRPYLSLARAVIRRRGLWKTLRAVGRYARENAWQCFLWRDVRRNDGRHRCLEFHDRHLARLLDHRPFDTLAALLLAIWFYLYLPIADRISGLVQRRRARTLSASHPQPP